MDSRKDERVASLLRHLAAEYFSVESNKNTMITFTKVELSDRGRRAAIFFTVMPTEREEVTLEFVRRKRNDFRKSVMEKDIFGFMPQIDFRIDEGEHNRQRIDELLNQ